MKEKEKDVEDFTEDLLIAWKEKEDGGVQGLLNPPKEAGQEPDDLALAAEPVDFQQ